MDDNVKKWIEKDGVVFLKNIGLKEGQTMLDFGCGEGHYTIPAAKVVGKKGKVYALDKDLTKLLELRELIRLKSIKNTETLSQDLLNLLKDNSIDTVLCYDVLHYQDKKKRAMIYSEMHRVLNNKGIFSVYPKHYRQDYPLDELADMDLENVIEEVEQSSFRLKKRSWEYLLHDNYYNKGIILTFVPLNK